MQNYIFPFLWMRGESEHIMRDEIEKIYECGIRAVCLEARPHDDFCGDGWWRDMDIVLDEAKKRDMKIWILDDKHFPTGYANGLIEKKYPERKKIYINCTTADVFGSQHKLTLNVSRMLKPTIGFWEIGLPVNYEERARNSLLAVVAVRFDEGSCFREEVIDLTDAYDGKNVSFTLPEGQWRIHVIYKTRTDGGNEAYINLIDKVSAHTQIEGVYEAHYERYADEFGKTIAGFFSDKPQFGNISEQCFDTRLGKKKMPLPWSPELQEMLEERYGNDSRIGYRQYLPFLFIETREMEICPQMRYNYMDCVSKLYERNFSRPIGEWCEAHGVEYIGHVVEDNGVHSRLGLGAAHYFRAMSGQHMAGIDAIGGQVVFGAPAQTRKGMVEADGEFFHFVLGKMGSSSGHLDPKKKGRTMCELFGAYGWNFGVRNMKYLLDHMLVKGVNHLVPHAFSMAEYPDIDCPPHFYARGNNPQFLWFAELMKYGNRMCGLLNGGTHVSSVAVLYDGEADWTGDNMPMQKVCRVLIENQIEFDIVCLDMLLKLGEYNGSMKDGKLIINNVAFDVLLIPYVKYAPEELMKFVSDADNLPIYFVGGLPEKIMRNGHEGGGFAEICAEKADYMPIEINKLAETLKEKGFYKISLDYPFPEMNMYHYYKDRQILMFQNESPSQAFSGNVILTSDNEWVYYDAYKDIYMDAVCQCRNGQRILNLELEPGESAVVMEKHSIQSAGARQSYREQIKGCDVHLDISDDWNISMAKAKDYPQFEDEYQVKTLCPVSDSRPDFSGIVRYTKEISLDKVPQKAYLSMQHVYEAARLQINGKDAGTCLAPPYQLSVDYLQAGINRICIEIASTPARDQMNYPMPPFDFSHEALEPSGMFGKILLHMGE